LHEKAYQAGSVLQGLTEHLVFEKYDGILKERSCALEADLTDRDRVYLVWVHHRTGAIVVGAEIVIVVVITGHRDVAFRTVEAGIDHLKEEVPIFKKEVTIEDTFLAHEREGCPGRRTVSCTLPP